MADSKVERTRRMRAASTTSSAGEIDDIISYSCRSVPARAHNAERRRPKSGLPALRLAQVDSQDDNAANPGGQLPDVGGPHFHVPLGTRPPSVHENIQHQCEAFLRDFSSCPNLATPPLQSAGQKGLVHGGTGSSETAPGTAIAVTAIELKGMRVRTALRSLVSAPGVCAEAVSVQLQAFCGFLQSLGEARAGTHPSSVRAFCQSESTITASAMEFARNHFDRLQNTPEVALHAGGDVVFLLLGCLAGKGINEIWSSEAMHALPIAHLAYLNALASAAVKKPGAVKRVA
jgi:hypothetical protein